ncbi:uncharacterized protein LOC130047287 [Ostrea edulis]|uniref:uncharacterized protein LOC130047287 n=1 Tax=Ostrea edulis TaxID=37623 RepID=UPI0024AF3A2B|nr:uncharacterized protein LOC130047287 [Ostrea edulis]
MSDEEVKVQLDTLKAELEKVKLEKEAEGGQQLLFAPKLRKVEKFPGKKGHGVSVYEFTEEMTRILKTRHTPQEEQVDFVLSHLEGPAKEEMWFHPTEEKRVRKQEKAIALAQDQEEPKKRTEVIVYAEKAYDHDDIKELIKTLKSDCRDLFLTDVPFLNSTEAKTRVGEVKGFARISSNEDVCIHQFLSTGMRGETVVLHDDVTGDPPAFDTSLLVPDNMKCTSGERQKFLDLFLRNHDVFAKNDLNLGCTETEVQYLGYTVSKDGVSASEDKVKVVEDWVLPTTLNDLRGFLGFSSYYRRFVSRYAHTAKPLYGLIAAFNKQNPQKSNGQLKQLWTPECSTVFNMLKAKLTSTDVLGFANYSKPFILETDASLNGLGAVLMQEQEGKRRVIANASRTLRPTERNDGNYSSAKLELLAFKWAVTEKFKDYLWESTFEIMTDSNPICYLQTSAKLRATEQCWAMQLAQYDFTIKYRPGKENTAADALSRLSRSKLPHLRMRLPISHLLATKPNEIVAMDFTLLEKSSDGRENVLVLTDVFSKFSIAIPT